MVPLEDMEGVERLYGPILHRHRFVAENQGFSARDQLIVIRSESAALMNLFFKQAKGKKLSSV